MIGISVMSLKHIYLLFFQTALSVLSNLPSYVFYVILLVWYVYKIASDVHIHRTGRGILFTHEKVLTIVFCSTGAGAIYGYRESFL